MFFLDFVVFSGLAEVGGARRLGRLREAGDY